MSTEVKNIIGVLSVPKITQGDVIKQQGKEDNRTLESLIESDFDGGDYISYIIEKDKNNYILGKGDTGFILTASVGDIFIQRTKKTLIEVKQEFLKYYR